MVEPIQGEAGVIVLMMVIYLELDIYVQNIIFYLLQMKFKLELIRTGKMLITDYG